MRRISERSARICENALPGSRCRCRCRGALHGVLWDEQEPGLYNGRGELHLGAVEMEGRIDWTALPLRLQLRLPGV